MRKVFGKKYQRIEKKTIEHFVSNILVKIKIKKN